MEAIGLVASIIQLVDCAAKALLYLNDVKTSSKERASLTVEISDVSARVTALRFRVENLEKDDPYTRALESLRKPMDQMTLTMQELCSKLEVRGSLEKLVRPLAWSLEKKVARDYIQRIERFKTLVVLALNEDLTWVTLGP